MRLASFILLLACSAAAHSVVQDFDGWKINVPINLPKTEEGNTTVWSGEVKDGDAFVEAIRIMKTDLSGLANVPDSEDFLDLHDRAQRTNRTFAAQLFLTQKTKLGELPFVSVTGSMLGPGATNNVISIYFNSAAFRTETHAYEAIWVSYSASQYANAFTSLRDSKWGDNDPPAELANKFGNTGTYSILGVPFGVDSRAPFLPQIGLEPRADDTAILRAMRYEDEINWVLDVRQRKVEAPEISDEQTALDAVQGTADFEVEFIEGKKTDDAFEAIVRRKIRDEDRFLKVIVRRSGHWIVSLTAEAATLDAARGLAMDRLKKGA
ncbi:MAG: hypothetical protein KF812_03480 [Fimbriimonadaceae bacterium]|nr:hypothetical protein [Fimbriimonadaceae bacterium]MBX3334587.1 hypothetical protein [Nitrospira sp.]